MSKFKLDFYREGNRWYVNDTNGYSKEENELVAGIPEIIYLATGNPDIQSARAIISTEEIPDSVKLEFVCLQNEGIVYRLGSQEGWLCPVFWYYFDDRCPPRELWVYIRSIWD